MLERIAVVTGLLLVASAVSHAETVYVWRDSGGTRQFSDVCPPGERCRTRQVTERRKKKLLYQTDDAPATTGTTDDSTTSASTDTSSSATATSSSTGAETTSTAETTAGESTTTVSETSTTTSSSSTSGSSTTQNYQTGYVTGGAVLPPPSTGIYAYNTFKPGATGFPAVGGSYVDPVFGGVVRRLTDTTGAWNDDQIYAHHWANANGTYAFFRNPAKGFSNQNVVEVASGKVVYVDQPDGIGAHENYWDAIDPDKYYYFSGPNLVRRNLSSQTNTTVKTFPGTLQTVGGSLNIQSRDGRYFTVRYNDTNKVWDSQTDTIYSGAVPMLKSTGWVTITPDAKYIVVAAGTSATPNTEHYSYPINHTTKSIGSTPTQFWGLCGDHGSVASASNGRNYFITFNCHSGVPGVYRVDISLNQAGRTADQQMAANELLVPISWNDSGHMSTVSKGPLSDWVFVSIESVDDDFNQAIGTWRAFRQEILAVNVVTLEVRRLAHHRSRKLTSNYQAQPRVSSSWDGSLVMWASNFNVSSPNGYADLYAILFPLGIDP